MEELLQIPGVGKSIASDLLRIGIASVNDLRDKDPEALYELSSEKAGSVQDRCLLICFQVCRLLCLDRRIGPAACKIEVVELEGFKNSQMNILITGELI